MLLNGSYPPDPRVRKEVKAIKESGNQVTVVCRGKLSKEQVDKNTTIKRFPLKSITPARLFSKGIKDTYNLVFRNEDFRWSKILKNNIDEKNFDILHVHDIPISNTVIESTNLPVLLDLHENWFEAVRHYNSIGLKDIYEDPERAVKIIIRPPWVWRVFQGKSLNKSDYIITPSEEVKKEVNRSFDFSSPIDVVKNTVDIEWFNRCIEKNGIIENNEVTLIYTGSVSGKHRGLDTVIRALPMVLSKRKDIKVKIVGDGDALGELKRIAKSIGVESHVEFTGWVDEDLIPSHILGSDIGICTHRENNHTNTMLPHKLFQYLAGNCPVLATSTRSVQNVMKENDIGWILQPEDSELIAQTIINIDYSELKYLSSKTRKVAEKKYRWSNDASTLIDIYEEIL